MSGRALSFGVVAEAYERFRPGYPAELFDMVMTYAGQPVRTALEIGAGTGKATRLFAQRGVTVTATEPDGAMLAELRKHVPANVKTVQAAFEDLRPGESYGLVYAAAALHWTNPQGRWPRMAALLEPGGVFASFGGPVQLADPAVEEAVRVARAPFLRRAVQPVLTLVRATCGHGRSSAQAAGHINPAAGAGDDDGDPRVTQHETCGVESLRPRSALSGAAHHPPAQEVDFAGIPRRHNGTAVRRTRPPSRRRSGRGARPGLA